LEKDYITESFITCQASPSIIRAVKSRVMRLAGHVAQVGEMRHAYSRLFGKPEEMT